MLNAPKGTRPCRSSNSEMKKVNLGSGTTCLSDWINIDNSLNARLAKRPRLRLLLFKMKILPKALYEIPWDRCSDRITIHDARKKLPFADNSVDYIYSSHLIDQFSRTGTAEMLNECYRVLKNQGLTRLVTTDLEKIANNYVRAITHFKNNLDKNGSLASEGFLSFIFLPDSTRSYLPFRQKPLWRRSWIYDYQSLARLLESCGFAKIKKRDYRVGEMPDISLLDNRPDHSLYIDAKKCQVE